ncbi:diguanylate cyclase [Rhodobacterales bacterium]|nr:diguanylate cyclase [Rhodobacterales bacterium]
MEMKEDILSGTDLLRPQNIDFETLLKLSDNALFLLAMDGTAAYISPAAERMFGWSAEKLAAQLGELVYVEAGNQDAVQLHTILSGAASADASLPQSDVQLRSASGRLVWAEVTTHLLRDPMRHPYAFAVYFQNISRRKELEYQVETATQTDALTGLFNRRAFEEGLKREWSIALREKTHTSLIKVSLDRFEALEDHLGQGAARECLTRVAGTLQDTARRPADIVARTASSEFSILLPRTHELGSETISAYIQVAIQDLGILNPENSAGNGLVTASVGAACAVADKTVASDSPEILLSAAEECVFEARREGGNRVKTVIKHLGQPAV